MPVTSAWRRFTARCRSAVSLIRRKGKPALKCWRCRRVRHREQESTTPTRKLVFPVTRVNRRVIRVIKFPMMKERMNKKRLSVSRKKVSKKRSTSRCSQLVAISVTRTWSSESQIQLRTPAITAGPSVRCGAADREPRNSCSARSQHSRFKELRKLRERAISSARRAMRNWSSNNSSITKSE